MSDTLSIVRASLGRIVRRELAALGILVTYEYRVVRQAGPLVDLQIVRKSDGLPDVARVVARPSAPGYSVAYTLGSLVLVAFVAGDPRRPFVAFGGEVGAPGTLPITATIDATGEVHAADAVGYAARYGDKVAIDPITGVLTFVPGPPSPLTPSRVKL